MKVSNVLLNTPSEKIEPLYEFLNCCSRNYKQFCILETAMKINLFNHLGDYKSSSELSQILGTDPELTKKICSCLFELGFIEEKGDTYKNTNLSDLYLKNNSFYCQQEVLINIKNGFKLWDHLDNVMINGPIKVSEESYFKDNLIHSLASEIICGELQKTVKIIEKLPEFKNAQKLLDLGGGHGFYSIALTQLNRNLISDVFDFPDVLKETQNYIDKFKAQRVNLVSGNIFKDDLKMDYDLVLFSYNPGGKNPDLVPKIAGCLKKGGLFISKHTFYASGEGSKDQLLDIEYNLSDFEGIKKESKIYSFAGDLTIEEYMKCLEKYFSIIKVVDVEEFGTTSLSKFGDALDSKIIIAKRK